MSKTDAIKYFITTAMPKFLHIFWSVYTNFCGSHLVGISRKNKKTKMKDISFFHFSREIIGMIFVFLICWSDLKENSSNVLRKFCLKHDDLLKISTWNIQDLKYAND